MPRWILVLALLASLMLWSGCTVSSPAAQETSASGANATASGASETQGDAAENGESSDAAAGDEPTGDEPTTTAMFGINLGDYPLWVNVLIFAIAGAIVWFAGTRFSYFADAISDRTGLDQAFMGLLFVALATELPEIATTITATLAGDPRLATSNIFGGIVLQTAILAIVDVVAVRGALTYFTPKPALLLQGMFLILLIGLTLVALVVGEMIQLFHIGGWSISLLVAYLLSLFIIHRYIGHERWQPVDLSPDEVERENQANGKNQPREEEGEQKDGQAGAMQRRFAEWSLWKLIGYALLASAAILVAGVALARAGEALAVQSGLGSSFVGATLLASSTSLPELSTSLAAVRIGAYSMAVSNIFGSNSIMILLLFVSDIFYTPGPILAEVESASMFTAAMGIVVTVVYLIGMIEWKNRTIFRMGIDSAVVMVLYVLNVGILYMMR